MLYTVKNCNSTHVQSLDIVHARVWHMVLKKIAHHFLNFFFFKWESTEKQKSLFLIKRCLINLCGLVSSHTIEHCILFPICYISKWFHKYIKVRRDFMFLNWTTRHCNDNISKWVCFLVDSLYVQRVLDSTEAQTNQR